MHRTKVTIAPTATLHLQLADEPDSDPIDLAPTADMLVNTGKNATPTGAGHADSSRTDDNAQADNAQADNTQDDTAQAGPGTVEFGTLTADGDIRFYIDGKRITTEAGLQLVVAGLRHVLQTLTEPARTTHTKKHHVKEP